MGTPITTTGQLAPLLQRLRKNQGLSQAGLGQKLGLSQERISRIERFPEKVTLDQLLTVLMALDAELQVVPRHTLSGRLRSRARPAASCPGRNGNGRPPVEVPRTRRLDER
jgi:HTH-type transcriptional regulator/antitoxin HipB